MDQLEPRNSHPGSVDDSIQSQTQPSPQTLHIPFTFSIAIDSESDDSNVKNTSVSLSSSSSSSSSSTALEPHQKRQRVQKYADADGDTVIMCDEATSMDENVKDNATEKILQEMASMKQEIVSAVKEEIVNAVKQVVVNTIKEEMSDVLMQIMQITHGHHTKTMMEVIDVGHATTSSSSQDMCQQHNIDDLPSHLTPSPSTASGITADAGVADTTTTIATATDANADADADADVVAMPTTAPISPHDMHDSMDAESSSSSLLVSHHNTQQFTITPIAIPFETIPAAEKLYPYSEMRVDNQDLLVPSMILCVLANNPDMSLPLESFQASLFDPMHALNKESFHLSCQPIFDFTHIANVTLIVVYNRIRCALYTLYPKVGIYGPINIAEVEAMALELEKGPIQVLESIVRDGLAVWNPIRMLITHLEAVTMQYSKCTTHDAQRTFRRYIADTHSWMRYMADMAVVYGHYLWDSQWVSNDEWDTLVEYMTTLTTKMFPKEYDSLLKMDSGPRSALTKYDRNIIDYFKHLLGIISCCFLHHYRPVKGRSYMPYRSIHNRTSHLYTIPESVYQTAVVSSKALFKQCVAEYMDHPTVFPQFSPMENLLLHSTTTTDDYASPRDYIMSEVELACNSHTTRVLSARDQDGVAHVAWRSVVQMYRDDYISRAFYLTDSIIRTPPRDDPVYRRISKIYPTDVNRETLIGKLYSVYSDPQYQMIPVRRT